MRVHDALVKGFLGGEIVEHIRRDSTAIAGREKPARVADDISRLLGHVPIIDRNPRGREAVPMVLHKAERYKGRSVAGRANSRLKEDFGADRVMVKGHNKVTRHLMFGVITLFADQLIRLLVQVFNQR